MIFFLLFNPTIGFGTEFMQWLGVFGDNPLSSSTDSFMIVLVADIWKTTAFMALLILAGLQSIDRGLYDVAKVSGASPWQIPVSPPLVAPALLVAMLFRTMDAMRIYGLIDATAGCETVPSLTCLVIIALQNSRRWATASAVAFLTAIVISGFVVVYLLALRGNDGVSHEYRPRRRRVGRRSRSDRRDGRAGGPRRAGARPRPHRGVGREDDLQPGSGVQGDVLRRDDILPRYDAVPRSTGCSWLH